MDGETSQDVLRRLEALHPKVIDLSLERVKRLLGSLNHPEDRLPPVVHVAGTNGKGSVIAFLRAIFDAHGLRCHVFTSPHLIRFHERIVIAGKEIAEDALVDVLETCERVNAGAPITFFEITTAAALLAWLVALLLSGALSWLRERRLDGELAVERQPGKRAHLQAHADRSVGCAAGTRHHQRSGREGGGGAGRATAPVLERGGGAPRAPGEQRQHARRGRPRPWIR